MKKYLTLFSPAAVMIVVVFGGLLLTNKVEASSCKFDRDLDTGVSDGADILCLQKYLNENGFPIARSGVGSKRKETNQYKTLTKEAVAKWQKANNLTPGIGVFGAKSRAKYSELMSGTVAQSYTGTKVTTLASGAVDVSPKALALRIAELKDQLAGIITTPVQTTPTVTTTVTPTALQTHLRATVKALQNAETQVDNNSGATDYKRALSSLTDARADFLSAVITYLDSDNVKTNNFLTNVEVGASNALKYVGVTTGSIVNNVSTASTVISTARTEANSSDATKKLMTVNSHYSSVNDKIQTADNANKPISRASSLLKQAKSELTEAKTKLLSKDYAAVIDNANRADTLITSALNSLST